MPQSDKHRSQSTVRLTRTPLQEVKEEDIISGCLSRAQWMDMLIQEEADETVGEILEEVLSNIMELCFNLDIERQLLPFSVSWAKSYLTQNIEQQILYLDEGERPEETSKTEDSEPQPTTADGLWVQECVPIYLPTSQLQATSQQDVGIDEMPIQTEPTVHQQCYVLDQTNNSPELSKKQTEPSLPKQPKKGTESRFSKKSKKESEPSSPKQSGRETTGRRHAMDKLCRILSSSSSLQFSGNKTQHINLLSKPIPKKSLPTLPCLAEKKVVEVAGKNQTPSVTMHTSGSLYQRKDYQLIPKIKPSQLPQHSIFPQYEILDENPTKTNSKKTPKLPKLGQRHNMHDVKSPPSSLNSPSHSKRKGEMFKRRNLADTESQTHRKEAMVSSGHLRLDTMELAEGVSLLEPQTAEMNNQILSPPVLTSNLRLIQSGPAVPLLSVAEVTAGPLPQVIPLLQSKISEG
ncbi:uncharacterized protein V6R79_022641 [Siganus canaliculatus]